MHALAAWMFIMPWALDAAGAAAVEMVSAAQPVWVLLQVLALLDGANSWVLELGGEGSWVLELGGAGSWRCWRCWVLELELGGGAGW